MKCLHLLLSALILLPTCMDADGVSSLENPQLHRASRQQKWVRTGGPLGGIGYDVRIDPDDPDIIYVTDQWAGCHRSDDGGRTWHPKNNGITSRFGPTNDSIPIFCLTVDPNDPNIVWCGTRGMRGVYRSTDKAENWALKANGIPNTQRLTFRSFAVEPGNSDVVYCGVEWALYENEIPVGQVSASKGKIYKTTDGGQNWFEVLDSDALVRTIIIHPADTNILYAATGVFDRDDIQEEGIWKSTDGGQNWFHINSGITNLTVGDIEMHPENPDILLAAAGRINGFGGGPDAETGEILRTVDGGLNWSRVFGGFENLPFTYVEFDGSNPAIVYAAASDRGFFRSLDGGITWVEKAYNPPYVNPGHIISIATHKNLPDWIISNSYGGGVFISRDGADHWQDASKGYTGCEITDLALESNHPLKIYATARSSIFSSLNGGHNWQGIGAMREHKGVPLGPLEMRSLAIHPQNPDIILSTDHTGAIYKTGNGGKNWKLAFQIEHPGWPEHEINTIAFAPSNPEILYAGAEVQGGYQIDRLFPFDPTKPSKGVLKSTDTGETWTFINTGLESTLRNVSCLAVHPANPAIVYIGTLNSGVYKTTDGGENWFESTSGIMVPDVRAIAIDPFNPSILYTGAQRGGIYKSTNAGETWRPTPYGMDPEAAIRSIVIDPTHSQTVYAGDWFSGVYRSQDGGSSWVHINEGLRTRAVHRLAISSDGKILYAGTQGEGVFRLALSENAPLLQTVSPDTAQVVRIFQGDPASFEVTAFDLNGDALQFNWSFDDAPVQQNGHAHLLLETDSRAAGEHRLSVSVSDSVSVITANWLLQITPGLEGDFNRDGKLNFPDFIAFAQRFGAKQGDADFDAKYDLSGNGTVDFPDFIQFARIFGREPGSGKPAVNHTRK